MARSWTLDNATAFVRLAEPVAHQEGYMVALYGSVVSSGSGRDLDALLVPWRDDTSPERAVRRIAEAISAQQIGGPYFGAMNTYAVNLECSGRVIDLQVREYHRTSAWTNYFRELANSR